VQVDPGMLQLTPRLVLMLETKCDELLSNFAFNFNLRPSIKGSFPQAFPLKHQQKDMRLAGQCDWRPQVDPGFSQLTLHVLSALDTRI